MTEKTSPPLPPLEYLLTCSKLSLQDLELAGLDRSRQHLKAARLEIEEAIEQRDIASVARFLIDNRPEIFDTARRIIEAQATFEFPTAERKTA